MKKLQLAAKITGFLIKGKHFLRNISRSKVLGVAGRVVEQRITAWSDELHRPIIESRGGIALFRFNRRRYLFNREAEQLGHVCQLAIANALARPDCATERPSPSAPG